MKRGFSLLEVMMAIAILNLIFVAEIPAWKSFSRLQRESDFGYAVRNAQFQLEAVQKIPFDLLPPQVLTPDSRGWVRLGQFDIDPASLQVRLLQGQGGLLKPLDFDPQSGRFRVDSALRGKALFVDYDFFASDHDESHRVPETGPARIPLENTPAIRVERCWRASGNQLLPLAKWRLNPDGTALELDDSLRGAVVVVDYRGQRVANVVAGEFLDETLHPLDGPSPIKQINIRQRYGQHETMQVSCLRINAP